MTHQQVSRLRNIAGKWVALCGIFFFAAAFDAIISQTRQPLNLIELTPGTSEKINFHLKDKTDSTEVFSYKSDSELIRVSFDSVHKGFWLGGLMCQGTLSSANPIAPGDYQISIHIKGSNAPIHGFKVRVYRDMREYRNHSKSFIFRYVGISPWWAMIVCAALFLLSGISVFYLSRKREILMASSGVAEIYQVSRKDVGCEISFAMGKKHGIDVGTTLRVCDDKGDRIVNATVISVSDEDASAEINTQIYVRPGYIVSVDKHEILKTS